MSVVRLTEFWQRMHEHFGPIGADTFARDQVLSALGNRSVLEALASGEAAKDVWRAVCQTIEVPQRLR